MSGTLERSFDDLDTPLHDVTFCVVDLETTGGSASGDAITEIGAVKVRGGQRLGTFQTLVNPGVAIPPTITLLTGITEAMLLPAPPIEAVLPTLTEFVGGAVLVGHNLRFDVSFLDAALGDDERPHIALRRVDTVALARRLLREEVANCQLGTLAQRFGLSHQPSHRALDDALATVDLLHVLLERAAAFGVTALDDLLALPKMAKHPQAGKLRLTTRLPRGPGVYVFRDAQSRPLHVGKAGDVRTRVRSYFSSDDGRRIGPMLRELHTIEHRTCTSSLEAGVLEARLLHSLMPRYDRDRTRWRSYRYVKLTDERFPRLAIARAPRDDGAHYLGPLDSGRTAQAVIDAIETIVPLRRSAGQVDEATYQDLVRRVVDGLGARPDTLLDPLRHHVESLAAEERYEDAATVRGQAAALAGALRRQRRIDALRRAGRLVLELPDGTGAEITRGRLVRTWGPPSSLAAVGPGAGAVGADAAGVTLEPGEVPLAEGPLPRELADEVAYVAAWLDRYADRVRLVHVDGSFTSPLPALPLWPETRSAPPAPPLR